MIAEDELPGIAATIPDNSLPAVCLKKGDVFDLDGKEYEAVADAKRLDNGPLWKVEAKTGLVTEWLTLSAARYVRIIKLGERKPFTPPRKR